MGLEITLLGIVVDNFEKEMLREYLITTQSIDKFDDKYSLDDWCREFNYKKETFYKMYYLANKYLRKKYIIKI